MTDRQQRDLPLTYKQEDRLFVTIACRTRMRENGRGSSDTMGAERIAFASVIVVVLAYLASHRQSSSPSTNIDSVLRGLLREEGFRRVNGKNRVAVGFGSCVDYFSPAVEAVEALELVPPDIPRHHDVISSSEELAEAFAFHFSHGGAAEYAPITS